jgi:hypothetical protein
MSACEQSKIINGLSVGEGTANTPILEFIPLFRAELDIDRQNVN